MCVFVCCLTLVSWKKNGIYRIIFKNKVKAEKYVCVCACSREVGKSGGGVAKKSKVYREELDR